MFGDSIRYFAEMLSSLWRDCPKKKKKKECNKSPEYKPPVPTEKKKENEVDTKKKLDNSIEKISKTWKTYVRKTKKQAELENTISKLKATKKELKKKEENKIKNNNIKNESSKDS
jgi:rubrerythrin|tara:strand:+ start:240 stop:584 length:345 start_codon:yes stop_codon:yes gene_type:complete